MELSFGVAAVTLSILQPSNCSRGASCLGFGLICQRSFFKFVSPDPGPSFCLGPRENLSLAAFHAVFHCYFYSVLVSLVREVRRGIPSWSD